MTFTHALATNNYGPAKFIVDVNPANGTHTTIASALASAVSGDTIFIRPGTYTENLTLVAGVNLTAFECDSFTPNVTIVGKLSYSGAGTVTVSGIRLQTNGDFAIEVTGASASVLRLINCFLNGTNNTVISFTSSSASSAVNLQQCNGDIGTTGIAFFSVNSGGAFGIGYSGIGNSGNSTTANVLDGTGIGNFVYSAIVFPITSQGTAALNSHYSSFVTSMTNTTAITHNSTSGASFRHSNIRSGTASGISIGAGSSATLESSSIECSNANAITGAGTCLYNEVGLANLITQTFNVTTQTPLLSQFGIMKSTLQPAFLATHGVLQANVTGAGAAATVNFTTEVFDQNNNYDATNTFTAPLTGRYQFNAKLFINDAATSTFALLNIVTSNRTYQGNLLTPVTTASLDQYGLVAEALADMDAADTCIVQGTVFGMAGATADYPAGGTQTYFSGYLVC